MILTRRPVEMISPLSPEDCLHRLHISLIKHPRVTGVVGAGGAALNARNIGRPKLLPGPRLTLTVAPLGAGSRIQCVLALPWIGIGALGAGLTIFVLAFWFWQVEPILAAGPTSRSDLYLIALGAGFVAVPIGVFGLRVLREGRLLVAMAADATKGHIVAAHRPTSRPLVE